MENTAKCVPRPQPRTRITSRAISGDQPSRKSDPVYAQILTVRSIDVDAMYDALAPKCACVTAAW